MAGSPERRPTVLVRSVLDQGLAAPPACGQRIPSSVSDEGAGPSCVVASVVRRLRSVAHASTGARRRSLIGICWPQVPHTAIVPCCGVVPSSRITFDARTGWPRWIGPRWRIATCMSRCHRSTIIAAPETVATARRAHAHPEAEGTHHATDPTAIVALGPACLCGLRRHATTTRSVRARSLPLRSSSSQLAVEPHDRCNQHHQRDDRLQITHVSLPAWFDESRRSPRPGAGRGGTARQPDSRGS